MVDPIAAMADSSPEYEALATSVRRLIDATIRTEVTPETVASAAATIDGVTTQLSAALMPGSFGQRVVDDGQGPAAGNVVIGVRNPSAPPLVIHHESDGSVWTEFVLGAAYEGPPGHVHGGVSAMILDHVLGATAHKPGQPAYTGTLTLRYHRPTPLQRPLRAEAWIESVDGVKTFAAGKVSDTGGVTVSAEGVFIHPRI
ncbi:thioesterase [Mycobacterium sp. 852002-51163_SCH5372311]|uniref:PaaI family thioesterase n=1 Tax=Mycobacterium sp. 852002-51163_SCH5372311 TaxID=1834097 RepID=UPI0008025634|nr:PaaI family thioesterase [Mycobacterium sp. 852002-51163_SCH5372311]OBF85384.1 thioesterase [Mycobacterium sp. 852002-51163_SCH5372311]